MATTVISFHYIIICMNELELNSRQKLDITFWNCLAISFLPYNIHTHSPIRLQPSTRSVSAMRADNKAKPKISCNQVKKTLVLLSHFHHFIISHFIFFFFILVPCFMCTMLLWCIVFGVALFGAKNEIFVENNIYELCWTNEHSENWTKNFCSYFFGCFCFCRVLYYVHLL